MGQWSLHFLNARGKLDPYLERTRRALERTEARALEFCDPIPLDVIIRISDVPDIPELSVSGSAYDPGRIDITIDPFNPELDRILDECLDKTIFHEFHHALRWEGPGYGWSLGEALVSEGLAQHFVHQAMDCAPEPWESVLSRDELAPYAEMAAERFDDKNYNHSEWFFLNGKMPRWLGYTLGSHLVGEYLLANPEATPASLAQEPARSFYPFFANLK